MILKASLSLYMEIVFPGGGGSGRSPFESADPEGVEACGVVLEEGTRGESLVGEALVEYEMACGHCRRPRKSFK